MRFIGRTIYYLAWPLWLVYFRVFNIRCRVLMVCNKEVLLVKSFIGSGVWGLPGGGAKRGEDLRRTAARELEEETGVAVDSLKLQGLGERKHVSLGFSYESHIFVKELSDKPTVTRSSLEIADVGWFDIDSIGKLKIDSDAKFAIDTYKSRI